MAANISNTLYCLFTIIYKNTIMYGQADVKHFVMISLNWFDVCVCHVCLLVNVLWFVLLLQIFYLFNCFWTCVFSLCVRVFMWVYTRRTTTDFVCNNNNDNGDGRSFIDFIYKLGCLHTGCALEHVSIIWLLWFRLKISSA